MLFLQKNNKGTTQMLSEEKKTQFDFFVSYNETLFEETMHKAFYFKHC